MTMRLEHPNSIYLDKKNDRLPFPSLRSPLHHSYQFYKLMRVLGSYLLHLGLHWRLS